MKFSFTKDSGKCICFIKNPNLTKKKILAGGRGGDGGLARINDFFVKRIYFLGGWGGGGLE